MMNVRRNKLNLSGATDLYGAEAIVSFKCHQYSFYPESN